MRRFVIGIVVMSVAGCSQEPATSTSQPSRPSTLSGDFQRHTVSIATNAFELVLKSYESMNMIEARIVNLGSEPIIAFIPDTAWSLDVESDDGLKEQDLWGLPLLSDEFWWTLEHGQAVVGIIDLESEIDGSHLDDGWYDCVFVYDDELANGMSDVREYGEVSEVGRITFPSILVYIVDGKAIEWRPLDDN